MDGNATTFELNEPQLGYPVHKEPGLGTREMLAVVSDCFARPSMGHN